MLTVVCWKWNKGLHPKKKILFGADHVNTLESMLKRNLHIPFELVCVTDDPIGINPGIRVVPLWNDFADKGGCFVRMKFFSSEMKALLGERLLTIDLDCVIVNDITPLVDVQDEFKIWGEDSRKTPYCGAMWLMSAGSREHVWKYFQQNHERYVPDVNGKYKLGTDQKVISDVLYPHEPTWTKGDGVYCFGTDIRISKEIDQARQQLANWAQNRSNEVKNKQTAEERYELRRIAKAGRVVSDEEAAERIRRAHLAARKKVVVKYRKEHTRLIKRVKELSAQPLPKGELPANARVVFFNGAEDPSNFVLQRDYPWIRENYR